MPTTSTPSLPARVLLADVADIGTPMYRSKRMAERLDARIRRLAIAIIAIGC